MRFASTWLAFAGVVAAVVPISSLPRITTTTPNILPGAFIVELDNIASLPGRKRFSSPHEALYDNLRKRDIQWTVRREFNAPSLFVGASLQIQSSSDLEAIAAIPGVVAIRPVTLFEQPKPINSFVPTSPSDPGLPDTFAPHVLTGVDKVHALGINGQGIVIGVIDTGVDFNNPVLGGGFGPGFKIIGGTDFVGNAYTGSNQPVPGPIPLDTCNGHGTHVSGIIGANPGNEFNISGVVPDSLIRMYRVFGCTGFVSDDVLVDALLLGFFDGNDILSLSLGGASGWTESTTAVLASKIADNGLVVTIAAGNDGAVGTFFTSSPGNGIDVISAASLDNTVVPIQAAITSNGAAIDYFSFLPLPILGNLPIFITSTNTSSIDDACNPLPDDTPDLSGFLVLIQRGTCTFVQKLTNAAQFGATAFLIYNDPTGVFAGIDVGNFTAALIQNADGISLVNQVIANTGVTISFPQTGGSVNFPNPTGGLMSTFTSFGPTNDMFFKPALAAPGGDILSTLPLDMGGFGVDSGTSMATPFLAGSAAILIQVMGKSVVPHVRDILQTTAKLVPSSLTGGDPLASAGQQGAGLVNVFNAITFKTLVSPGQLTLNDTANFKGVQTFTMHNTGTAAQTYTLSHTPAGTAITQPAGSIFPFDEPVPLTTDAATVKLSATTVTLRGGESTTITAEFTAPTTLDSTSLPIYSGFINIQSATENLHVTYLGLASALKDAVIVDNTDEFFGVQLPTIIDASGNVQTGPETYTFDNVSNFPTLLFRLAFGSANIAVDLVAPDIDLNPTLQKRNAEPEPNDIKNLIRSLFSFWTPHEDAIGSFGAVPTVGNLAQFAYSPRSNDVTTAGGGGFNLVTFPTAVFANNSVIPNGNYKFLMRALKVTGDPNNEADYETWLSPVIGVDAS